MTNLCNCKAEHWQPHVESCPAYKPRPLLTVENIRSGAVPSDAVAVGFLLGEIELLRDQRDTNLAKEVETVAQLRGNLSLAEEGLANYALEVERLREVLTIPNITPDTTSSALFIRTLSEHEKGQPVNGQDLVNALMWRVKNQRKEIARLHEKRSPEPSDGLEKAARDRFNEVHRINPRDLWELQPEATKDTYREWAKNAQKSQGASRDASSEPSERHVDWEAEYKKLAGVYTREGLEKFIADHWPGNVLADATESKSNSCHCPAKPGEDCPLTYAEYDARRAQASYE